MVGSAGWVLLGGCGGGVVVVAVGDAVMVVCVRRGRSQADCTEESTNQTSPTKPTPTQQARPRRPTRQGITEGQMAQKSKTANATGKTDTTQHDHPGKQDNDERKDKQTQKPKPSQVSGLLASFVFFAFAPPVQSAFSWSAGRVGLAGRVGWWWWCC